MVMPSPKYCGCSFVVLDDLARFELDLPHGRASLQSRAFVEKAVEVFEALGIRLRIVRISCARRCIRTAGLSMPEAERVRGA